jgi:phage replication initiation protein
MDDGEVVVVEVPPVMAGQYAIIDWVQFTVSRESFRRTGHWTSSPDGEGQVWVMDGIPTITDEDEVLVASQILTTILGYGVTGKRDRGMMFYRDAYILGDGWGYLCIGGQRDTLLVVLTGHACLHAADGWQHRLHRWFTSTAKRPKITRIDLAVDYLTGAVTVQQVREAYRGGRLDSYGQHPSCDQAGPWDSPRHHHRGLTYYVGRRTSGKFLRAYEKGRQLGDGNSPWVRLEVEIKSAGRLIPLDVLLRPSDYWAGSYDYLAEVAPSPDAIPERIAVAQKTAEISVERAVEVIRHQMGAYVHVLRDVYGDTEFLQLVDRDAIPRHLRPVMSDLSTCPPPLIERGHLTIPVPAGWA